MIRAIDRPNWIKMIQELASVGMSGRRIAMILGVHPSKVWQLARGHEPKYIFGKAIIELHDQRCAKNLTL